MYTSPARLRFKINYICHGEMVGGEIEAIRKLLRKSCRLLIGTKSHFSRSGLRTSGFYSTVRNYYNHIRTQHVDDEYTVTAFFPIKLMLGYA